MVFSLFHNLYPCFLSPIFMVDSPLLRSPQDYPLLIVDPVKGCCGREYERPEWNIHFSRVREMLPLPNNINKLYHENPGSRFYVEENVEEYDEFPDILEIDAADSILVKNSYSAFVNHRLSTLLDDAYLVAGVYADGCVNATIVEGWSK